MAAASGPELLKLMATVEKAASAASADGGDTSETSRAVGGLNQLKRSAVTTELLSQTQLGRRVKKLSKHADAGVAEAATAVVEAWKETVKREKAAEGGTPAAASEKRKEVQEEASQGSGKAAGEDAFLRMDSGGGLENRPVAEQYPPERCGNGKRDKARSLLAEALKLALEDVPQGDTGAVAVAVECAMLAQAGGTVNQQYLNKCRSLSFNLKKADNPDLRRNVLSGMLEPERLVNLTAEEMASDKLKDENKKIRERMMFEAHRVGQQKATTDQFRCGKCRQYKTTFYQLQTRSADEPMTTFVTCVNCGNRWKFC